MEKLHNFKIVKQKILIIKDKIQKNIKKLLNQTFTDILYPGNNKHRRSNDHNKNKK